MSLIKLAESMTKQSGLTDEQLVEARGVLSKLVAAARVSAGKRQADVYKEVGLNNATQSRIESGQADFRIDGMLLSLHASGFLDEFLHAVSEITPSADRSRVKGPAIESDLLEEGKIYSSSEFQAVQARLPGVELRIQTRSAAFISRRGFAVRSCVIDGVPASFATTMSTAVDSEHSFQAPSGDIVGGVRPLTARLASKKLTDLQYSNVRLQNDSFIAKINELFRKERLSVRVRNLVLDDSADDHIITHVGDTRRLEMPCLYDVVLESLNAIAE
jgi:hypothetical protein